MRITDDNTIKIPVKILIQLWNFPYKQERISQILVRDPIVHVNLGMNNLCYLVSVYERIFLKSFDDIVKVQNSAESINSLLDSVSGEILSEVASCV